MLSPALRYPALAIAVLLIAAGAAQIARAIAAAERVRTQIAAPGPMRVGDKLLTLIERPGPDVAHVFVDISIGDRRLPGNRPVWIDETAEQADYARRYGGRFVFFEPVAGKANSWQMIEHDHGSAPTQQARYRLIDIAADGTVGLRNLAQSPAAARKFIAENTFGARPARPFILPAPLIMIVGAALALAARLRSLPAGWPTVLMVWAVAASMSLLAWAPMVSLGLKQSLPAPTLAFVASSLVAVLAGPRLQAIAGAGDRRRAAIIGAIVAIGLLLVFVLVQVTSNAFIAPAVQPAPAGGFMRAYGSPALLLGMTGAPTTILAGLFYGLACWWSRHRMSPV